MAQSAAARRYAKALFAIARQRDCVAQLRGELASLCGLLAQSPALREVLLQPLHPAAARRAVLNGVAGRLQSSPLLRDFCAYLIDRRRLIDLEAVADAFAQLAEEAAGRCTAQVTSAAPLSQAQQERLRAALSARTGRQVALEIEVDDALIGGLVAQVGDSVFDGSLRTRLQRLRAGLAGA